MVQRECRSGALGEAGGKKNRYVIDTSVGLHMVGYHD